MYKSPDDIRRGFFRGNPFLFMPVPKLCIGAVVAL
jgi:hypothetical protein